jgi:DNA-binding NarL/FixJ family response regulator
MKRFPNEENYNTPSLAVKLLPSSKSTLQAIDELPGSGYIYGNNIRDVEKTSVEMINVLLVDDHKLMREGLRQLLSLEQDIIIIDEAVNGLEAIQKIRRLRPDVVLMDIRMPLADGIMVTQQMIREFPDLAVIMLTMCQQEQLLFQAMKSGARGYLFKDASSLEVAQAIRNVSAGRTHIDPALTDVIVSEFRRLSDSQDQSHSINGLTDKEIEILRYIAAGMSNKEIANELSYSEKTVKNYLSTIFQKLEIRDRTQAAIFAYRSGLLPEEF